MMRYKYNVRFRQWRFWALLGFATFDLLIPFLPFSALILGTILFSTRVELWAVRLLETALRGPWGNGR